MADKGGYIKLYRSLLHNELWITDEPFDMRSAWIDLLLMANYADSQKIYRGEVQKTKRGQIQTSIAALAKRWHWSESKTRRYTKMLKMLKMVQTKSTTHGTTITIEKYTLFQDARRTDDRTDEWMGDRTGDRTGDRHNKKVKKEKKEEEGRNTPPPSSDDLVPTDPEEQERYLDELFARLGIGNDKEAEK